MWCVLSFEEESCFRDKVPVLDLKFGLGVFCSYCMNMTSIPLLAEEPKMLFLFFLQEWNDSHLVVNWFDLNFQVSWHYHIVNAVLSETPEAALKGQNLKMVFAIYFVLEMEMLSCADWIAKISDSFVFCLKILYSFLKLLFFVCVLNR